MIAPSPFAILTRALEWIGRGEDVVLVTLVGIEGPSSRALGTQMAVSASGEHIGSFSGGCIEQAIVGEAQRVLEAGAGRTVRYGAGSPYIDVRLPCGGGIDLRFTPRPSAQLLRASVERLEAREPVRLFVSHDGITGQGPGFALDLHPSLRLLVAGLGEDFVAFVRLASAYGARIEALTPNAVEAEMLADLCHQVHVLARTTHLPALAGDAWTASVLLFHDRDWEDALLPGLLSLPAFYRGAVGSRRTHEARLARLREAGCDAAAMASLKGPIGLIPATRDPATLAISVLAEVAKEYAAACRAASPMVAAA